MLLCLTAITGCASATPSTARATGNTPSANDTSASSIYKPLLRCTSAQRSAASGPVHVKNVLGTLTIHVTVGERIDVTDDWTPIRPAGTGTGKVQLPAGQQVVCQSGDVQGQFTRGKPAQRLPLVITEAGHAVIQIFAGYEAADTPSFDVVFVDASAG